MASYINDGANARATEAAYEATRKLPWKWDSRRSWAIKKVADAIGQIGHALGLEAQIKTLRATGLEGRRLKAPFKRAVEGWIAAKTTPATDEATLVERVGEALGKGADATLTLLQTEAGQQAVNAALAAAGLPPIPVGDAAAALQDTLHTWDQTVDTPLAPESDPDLAAAETPSSSSSSSGKSSGGLGLLTALGVGLAFLRGR